MRKIEKPVERPHFDRPDESVTTHPAFAVVSSSRVSGGAHLFQSEFQHQYYRTLRVSGAELHRHLANDWVHSTDTIIEIAMSEAQWNHFVTNPNQEGTPCTLEHLGTEVVPGLPKPKARRHTFTDEAKEAAQEAFGRLETLIAEIDALSLSGARKKALTSRAESIRSALQSSMPFILEQFEEHMEETVQKAKVEIDAYASRNASAVPQLTQESTDSTRTIRRLKRG